MSREIFDFFAENFKIFKKRGSISRTPHNEVLEKSTYDNETSFVISAFALLWERLFPRVMNWRLASWIEAFRLHDLKTAFSWIELPGFSCRRQFMRCRRKSWRKPIHAHKGNSWWARIDNVGKSFVIARAHLLQPLIVFLNKICMHFLCAIFCRISLTYTTSCDKMDGKGRTGTTCCAQPKIS